MADRTARSCGCSSVMLAAQANAAVVEGTLDVVGLARSLVLDPDLPNRWRSGDTAPLAFPRFDDPPEGGVTAWYTMRLTDIASGEESTEPTDDLHRVIAAYEQRDEARVADWRERFAP